MLTEETKKELKERLREVNRQLNALLKLGSNDESLVDEKRIIEKQLKQK